MKLYLSPLLLVLICLILLPSGAAAQFHGMNTGKASDITYPRILLTEGKFEAAKRAFEEVYKTTNTNHIKSAALEGIGRAYEQMGEYEEAVKIYRRVLKEFPKQPRQAHVRLAELYVKLGRYEDAVNEYGSFLPRNLQYYTVVGDVYFKSGEINKAIETWYSWLGKNERSVMAYKSLSDIFYSHGLIDEAISVLLLAREKNRNSTLFFEEVAELYEFGMKHEKAAEEYILALLKTPTILNRTEKHIYALIKDQDDSVILAIRHKIESFVQKHPKADNLRILLADFYLKESQVEKAIAEYEKINSLKTDKDEIYFKLGQKLMDLNHYKDAAAVLLKINPKGRHRFDMQWNLAQAFYRLANFKQALAVVDVLINSAKSKNDNPQVHLLKSRILIKLGKAGLALDITKKIQAYNRGGSWAHQAQMLAAEINISTGRFKDGIDIYENLIRKKAQIDIMDQIVFSYSRALFITKNFQKSYDSYNLIVSQYQHSPYVNEALRDMLFIKPRLEEEGQKTLINYAAAEAFLAQNNYKKAEKAYRSLFVDANDGDAAARALEALIDIIQHKKEHKSLLQLLDSFDQRFAEHPRTDFFRIEKARTLDRELNQPKQALKVYYSVINDFPGSVLLINVRQEVRRLDEGKETKK